MPPAARFLCKQRFAIASHRQAWGCGFFDAVYGTGFGAEWGPGASNHRHYRHDYRRCLLLVARVRVEEKQLLWLEQWGNRLCEEAPAFFASSALVVHALVPLSKALLSATWGCCFVYVHIDVPPLPVWLSYTRFWWYDRLSVKLLLLRLFSLWPCSSPPFFCLSSTACFFFQAWWNILLRYAQRSCLYSGEQRPKNQRPYVCFIELFFSLLLRLQVPALICSWGCISRCCLEGELSFFETFVHIVVGDMDSLRFFSLSASISYFFDHETLCTLPGFKTSVTIRQSVVIINERSLIHIRTLDGNRCEKKKSGKQFEHFLTPARSINQACLRLL